jgi:hypothetical protein
MGQFAAGRLHTINASLGFELLQCPAGVFGNDWIRIRGEFFERFAKTREAGVSHRNCDVSQESGMLGSGNRRAAESLAKFIDGEAREFFERRACNGGFR